MLLMSDLSTQSCSIASHCPCGLSSRFSYLLFSVSALITAVTVPFLYYHASFNFYLCSTSNEFSHSLFTAFILFVSFVGPQRLLKPLRSLFLPSFFTQMSSYSFLAVPSSSFLTACSLLCLFLSLSSLSADYLSLLCFHCLFLLPPHFPPFLCLSFLS